MLGGIALIFMAQWMVRWAVRAELERAGFFRATRELSEREMQEVMGLIAAGKFFAANSLKNRYRHQIKQPE